MLLFAEVAAWFTRAAIFSIWLTGLSLGDSFSTGQKGFIDNLNLSYCLIIIVSLALNMVFTGLPEFFKNHEPCDLIQIDKININTFHTLLFLLPGSKVKEIIRNISFLTGPKSISVTADCSQLVIGNSEKPKLTDYLITIGASIFAVVVLVTSPSIIYLLFSTANKHLLFIESEKFIAGSFKYFSMLVLLYYLFPYAGTSYKYPFSTVRLFGKPLGNYYGYPVFSSIIMCYLESNKGEQIGTADPRGRIYVNPYYTKIKNVFNYVAAHEAGHLSDKLFQIFSRLLSPVLFPWGIFIILTSGNYLISLGQVFTGKLVGNIGWMMLFMLIILWPLFIKKGECRADDFAVKQIGITSVIKALEELQASCKTEGGMLYQTTGLFSGSVPFNKRLERIKQNVKKY